MAEAFILVIVFLANVVTQIFTMLDTVIVYSDVSVLHIFVALEYVYITLWGVFELIGSDNKGGEQ